MSKFWFKTSNYHPHITKVAIEKFTDSSVWIDGRRRARATDFEGYFPTFGDAKAHLLEKAEDKLANARHALQRAQGEHGNIAGLRDTTTANATQQRNATGGEG
jgi:outer membrane protein OmpA-like peptidoglycan-associated protein